MPDRSKALVKPPIDDAACVRFLREVLPILGLRWPGFRKVRRQVRKRLARRLGALGLADLDAYREHLAHHPDERVVLDAMCRIPISCFYRDRGVWDTLRTDILPRLMAAAHDRGDRVVHCWSAGCASGEEPYTLALCRALDPALAARDVTFAIDATDADPHLLARARAALYGAGSLRELPAEWRLRGFDENDGVWRVKPAIGAAVTFAQEDLRETMPAGPFDLILCRNLAFTYFADAVQRRIAVAFAARLHVGGALVLGKHETLPASMAGLQHIGVSEPIWRRV